MYGSGHFLQEFSNSSLQLSESMWELILKVICRNKLQVYFGLIKNLVIKYTSSLQVTSKLFLKNTQKGEIKKLPYSNIPQILKF